MRINKDVVTEQKQISVPVTREEVRVERVPASRTSPGDAKFERDRLVVPVMEEEVEITKRPVVREEVRVTKEARTEQRNVTAEVRREEADIDEEPDGIGRGTYPTDPHTHQ